MTTKLRMATLAATLGIATLCMAQGPGRHFGRPNGAARGGITQMESLKTYLGLSDTQVATLKQVRTDAFEQRRPELKENAQKARDLRAEMAKANPDQAVVGRLMTELKQSREQARSGQSQIQEKSLAVLTDAQKAKLKALEDAAALQQTVREARMSGLIAAPEAPAGESMRQRFGRRQ